MFIGQKRITISMMKLDGPKTTSNKEKSLDVMQMLVKTSTTPMRAAALEIHSYKVNLAQGLSEDFVHSGNFVKLEYEKSKPIPVS